MTPQPLHDCGTRNAECGTSKSAIRGFTLLELVLVMVIAATALAVAAPSLRGWRQGAALRNSIDELLTLTRYARTESISKGRLYRLEFDQELRFQLKMQDPYNGRGDGTVGALETQSQQDSAGFVPVPGDFGRIYSFPEGSRLEIEKAQVLNESQQSDARVIDFYPTGRTQPAKIMVTDSENFQAIVICTTPAGNFRRVSEGIKQ